MKFYKYFYETTNYRVPDFQEKWEKALSSSEELRVGMELLNKIHSLFPQKEIYIVGGVPRDIIMGNAIDDVDMATNISFSSLSEHFPLRNISKNDSQPVYTILYKNYNFDLAKFREDSKTVGRGNNVSKETDSFQKDTERRDITINSFGIDYKGRIVDYQNGLKDLGDKIVRAVGNPKERFLEDATRILRVFRFAAKMGFRLDEETRKAAVELKHLLTDRSAISVESISKELYKVAKSGKALAKFLEDLEENGILESILPEFTTMRGFMHNPKHHPEGGSSVLGHILECLKVSPYTDPVTNLAVLFHDFGKAVTRGEKNGFSTYYGHEAAGVPVVENIFSRLRFSELGAEDKKNILAAVEKHMLVHQLDSLGIKVLTDLITSPTWETVKAVGFCDEASRGAPLFNKKEFEEKIKRAEDKVHKLVGGNLKKEEMRAVIKKYVDGNKLLGWFPEIKNNLKNMKYVLSHLEEYILKSLEKDHEPLEEELKKEAESFLKRKFP
jgi:tRNA nucleotidyltransferase/poly(A) polymerase